MTVPGPMVIEEKHGVEWSRIPVVQTMFPDGQAHVALEYGASAKEVRITTTLQHPVDFLYLLLVKEVLDNSGCTSVDLFITYMSGARMDRRIDETQPFTLKVLANMIRDAGFRRIKVMDPHSDVTLALLDAEAVYPVGVLNHLLSMERFHGVMYPTVIIAPDSGATKRVETMLRLVGGDFPVVQGLKHRDMSTGKLSGFSVADNDGQVAGKRCLILDDICDGGGTFVGLADVLIRDGAHAVDLFVTHGIFSKGTVLQGIDHIYTTDTLGRASGLRFTVFSWAEHV